jgi:hypothetical protein
VQSVVSLCVGDRRIRIVRNKQLNDIQITVAGSPLHGSGNEVTSKCIYFRALLEEVAAGCGLSVNGGPVKRCDVLGITVGSFSLTRFYELADTFDVTTLCGDEYVDLDGENVNDYRTRQQDWDATHPL